MTLSASSYLPMAISHGTPRSTCTSCTMVGRSRCSFDDMPLPLLLPAPISDFFGSPTKLILRPAHQKPLLKCLESPMSLTHQPPLSAVPSAVRLTADSPFISWMPTSSVPSLRAVWSSELTMVLKYVYSASCFG